MKLHLPRKFQAALMAALASVSFTTLSSCTLAAAGVAFFGHCAAAQDPQNLIWDGANSTLWDTEHYNWHHIDDEEEGTSLFAENDNVTFEGDGSFYTTAVTLGADIIAGTMTLGNDARVSVTSNNSESLTVTSLVLGEGTYLESNASLNVLGGSVSITAEGSAFWNINANANSTISANIISVGAEDSMVMLGKYGEASTLTLSGDNSQFKDLLNVAEGTLAAASANALGSAYVTVDGAATLSLESEGEMTANSLTLERYSTIAFVGNTTLSLNALTLDSGVIWDLSAYSFSGNGTATLIQSINSIEGPASLAGVNILKPENITSASLSYDEDNGAVILTFEQALQRNLIWKGGSGTWNYQSPDWIQDNGDGTYTPNVVFQDKDNLSFVVPGPSDLQMGAQRMETGKVYIASDVELSLTAAQGALLKATDITVYGDVKVTDVAINAETLFVDEGATVTAVTTKPSTTYIGALTPDLSGTGTIIKQGEGSLKLNGKNIDFAGTFVIEGGTLIVDESGQQTHAMGANPNVVLAGEGAVLDGEFTATGDVHITSTASGTVSANINAPGSATLTFDTAKDTIVTASGTLSGNLFKDGEGTLKLTGNNGGASGEIFINWGRVETKDATSLGSGTIHVNADGVLALAKDTSGYDLDNLDVDYGGSLVFSGATSNKALAGTLLHLDKLFLHSSAYVDFSNVQLSAPSSGSSNKYYVAQYDKANWSEPGSVVNGLVQFVAMSGLNISGTHGDNIVSLHVDESDPNNKVLYLEVEAPHTGYYWNGRENKEWETAKKNWSTNYSLSGNDVTFSSDASNRKSVYFMQNWTETVTLTGVSQYELHDMIIGAGDYTFVSESGHTLHFDTNVLSNVIVRQGAKATFDKVALGMGQNSILHVSGGAEFTSRNASFEIYSINNEGKVDVIAEPSGEPMLAHITNTGTFKALWKDAKYLSRVMIGNIANLGDMTLGASEFMGSAIYGSCTINNDGKLTFDATCLPADPESYESSGAVMVYLPVKGLGDVYTTGDHTVRFTGMEAEHSIFAVSSGTISQRSLTIGAADNIFEEAVELSDFTKVESGKKASFYGGTTIDPTAGAPASMGELTLMDGTDADHQTQVTFGGYYHAEPVYDEEGWETGDWTDRQQDSEYYAGPVTAGANTVLTIEDGADVYVEGYNAGTLPAGTIVVGAPTSQVTKKTPLDYEPALLTVNGETNVNELDVKNGTANLQGGYATVNHLTQSGGQVVFNKGGYLASGNVSGGQMVIGENQAVSLGAVITETDNYEVINNGTGYIDASKLALITDTTTMTFSEVLYADGNDITTNQSGFAASGRQYVKVFDVQGGTLTANGTVIYHEKAAGLMTLISGDNPSTETYSPEGGGWAGYGYLNITQKQYMSYYVRDNYVSGNTDNRVDKHTTEVVPHPQVKLSDIVNAATQSEEILLENVVFDQTDYNKTEVVGATNFNGTLAVDVNVSGSYTEADLFVVEKYTRAAIDIAEDIEVLADENYKGVDGTLKLSGKGVYEINNRGDLGTGVSLLNAETDGIKVWGGTVRLSGSAEDVNMPDLSVGTGENASTIEFSHWNGTFWEGAQTSNGKIVLVGTGLTPTDASAITFAATNPDTTTTLTWTNSVTGTNARVDHKEAGNLNLTLTGDTSDWTGTFYQSAKGTDVQLTFDLQDQAASDKTQYVDVIDGDGSMTVTYGGVLEHVNGDALVYGTGELTLAYTGDEMDVNGAITQYGDQGNLHLVVGDDESNGSAVTFNGPFSDTRGADMTVNAGSTATINTNTPLLWVRGEEGSNVVVNANKTLELSSNDPENSYSQFYGLTNNGTIKMQADGGDIKLIDKSTGGQTYNMGSLVLEGVSGTAPAAIETSGQEGKTTEVIVSNLSSSNTNQVLQLMNENGEGSVNYNLGGATAFAGGTIQFGSEQSTGDANVVLNSDGVAANAVLQSIGNSNGSADVVVNTADAHVLGIDSADESDVGGKLYGVKAQGSDVNRKVTITGNELYSYNGALGENLDIEYKGTGYQEIAGGVDGFNGKVTVDNGSTESGVLAIQKAASVNITDLTIGANDTLVAMNADSDFSTAVVSGILTAKGGSTTEESSTASRLYGNLTLGGTSTLDVHNASGTGGLNLAGALTINSGAQLSEDDLAAVSGLGWYGMYDLAFNVSDMSSFGTVDWSQGVDATEVFAGTGLRKNEYYVRYSGVNTAGGNGNNVGAVYIYRIPEPTTSTLSLLALAALAARRRRK